MLKKKKESSVVVEDMYDALWAYSVDEENDVCLSVAVAVSCQSREGERKEGKAQAQHAPPKNVKGVIHKIQGYDKTRDSLGGFSA